MRSLKSSHPDYEELNDLSQRIAWAKNPQMVWEGKRLDLPKEEHRALVFILEAQMKTLLQGGIFKDFINQRETLKDLNDF